MFGSKEPQESAVAPMPSIKTDDMVIHVMPKDFVGKTASAVSPLLGGQGGLPGSVPVPVPQLPPKPQPVVAPVPVVVVAKPAVVVAPPPKKKFSLLVFLFALLFVVALGSAGTVYYLYFMPIAPVVAPEPIPEPTPVPTPIPTPVVTEPQPGKDTDSDGSTDAEELLYGTDYRNADTDGDSFLDGNEVFHRYNPNGPAPLTLLDTGAVRVFQAPGVPFTIYYPSAWNPVVDPSLEKVTFRSATTAAVIVTISLKASTDNLDVWYSQNVVGATLGLPQSTYTTEGLLAMYGTDQRVAYIDGGDKVFTLTYDLGDEKTIEYLTTFQMMLNSLTLLP